MGIAVGEIGNQANRHCVVLQVVEEGTTHGFTLTQGPAGAVDNKARLVLLIRDFPQLFNAQSIVLGFTVPYPVDILR